MIAQSLPRTILYLVDVDTVHGSHPPCLPLNAELVYFV